MFEVENGTGSPTATSYVSLAYVDDYMSSYFPDFVVDWRDYSTAKQQSEAMIVTQFIDRLVSWDGDIASEEQNLSFPRINLWDYEGRTIKGVPKVIKQSVVKLIVEKATNELSDHVEKLSQESFGDTTDVYASPKIISDNEVVRKVILDLIHMGYGVHKNSIVTVRRA